LVQAKKRIQFEEFTLNGSFSATLNTIKHWQIKHRFR